VFTKSARFYDALYAIKDYAGAARKLHVLIQESAPGARSLLDVGCGTGLHLEHLRQHYEVEGLDISGDLLAVARDRLPGVGLHCADMVDFRLPRRFDVVACLFSAIAYVRTLDRMQAAVATMAAHLQPGGLLVIEPWFDPERYWTGTITANHVDAPDLKIAWMYTSKREDMQSVLDIHYLVGTPEHVEHFTEEHRMGLFTHEQYLSAFRAAGVEPHYDSTGLFNRGLYWGRK